MHVLMKKEISQNSKQTSRTIKPNKTLSSASLPWKVKIFKSRETAWADNYERLYIDVFCLWKGFKCFSHVFTKAFTFSRGSLSLWMPPLAKERKFFMSFCWNYVKGFHEKIPRACSPAWAPIDGREGKSIPAKKTNRCFIHGCINKVILINNEIRSLPPHSWLPGSAGQNPRGFCCSCKWAWNWSQSGSHTNQACFLPACADERHPALA